MPLFKVFNKSLRLKLVIPYVVLIMLITVLIGWLSIWSNTKSITPLSHKLMSEMTERMAQAVDRHLYGTSAVLETAFPRGLHAPVDIREDLRGFITRFYAAASLFNSTSNYVYYGNELGQGFGLKRIENGAAELRIKNQADQKRNYFFLDGINGWQEYMYTEKTMFDPRERSWYLKGKEAKRHTWTSIYLDFGSKDLVVTRARNVVDESGKIGGVIATDLFLSGLSDFVKTLDIGQYATAFIVEPDGQLIASSSVDNVTKYNDGYIDRVSAFDSGDHLIDQVWSNLQPMLHDLDLSNSGVGIFEFNDSENNIINVAIKYIQDDAGLEWFAVVATPKKILLAEVYENTFYFLIIGALTTLLTLVVGMILIGRVSKDVTALSMAVKNTGNSQVDLSTQVLKQDEIGTLARNFIDMKKVMFTDNLTGIANRAAFDLKMSNALNEASQNKQAFAILFMDLNGFKPINDTYGHDMGDLVLIEVSNKLQSVLRKHDMLARIGGDEFIALVSEFNSIENIQTIAEKLNNALATPLECLKNVTDKDVFVGTSIGIAIYPEDGLDSETLVKCADERMYENKRSRRK